MVALCGRTPLRKARIVEHWDFMRKLPAAPESKKLKFYIK